MFPHRNSWQKSGFGSHKSYWPNGRDGLDKPMCRRKQCCGCKTCNFLLQIVATPFSPLHSTPSPLGLKLASEFPSVVPANNVSIPIYCLHLNPTTLVDTRRDAILVNVTDSSNYMNSRRQIWIIAINILNGEQIFSFPRAPNINLPCHPPYIWGLTFARGSEFFSQSDPFLRLPFVWGVSQQVAVFCLISWIRNTSSLLWS